MADDAKIVKIIQSYYADSRDSEKRLERIERSSRNNMAFQGHFDYSNKVDGMSCEVIPKVTTATESFAAYIRRGLAQFGEWFRVEMPPDDLLTPENVAAILKEYLKDMPDGVGGSKTIEQVISDGAKAGALDSLVVLKIHGRKLKDKTPPGIKTKIKPQWRLQIDLSPFEDYYPDPTGRKLYEIHRKEVDFFKLKKMAEAGMFGKEKLELISKGRDRDIQSDKDRLDRDNPANISRNTVVIMDFFGTLVDFQGEVIGEDVHVMIANDTTVLVGPEPIKAWSGSPFASGPLTRVPHSVWHRAVMDHVSDLNQSLNELFNLIFDAGISAVHGVKEVRLGWLEDATSIAGGIAPQQTIAINETAPAGQNAITVAKTGGIPGEVIGLMQLVEKEILESAMTNEIKLGAVPQKQILATEIISSDQATAVLLDSVLGEYEQVLTTALTKAWKIIVQNMPDMSASTIIRAIGEEKAVALSQMSDEERFVRYAMASSILVTGISAIQTRSKELQRLVAILATIKTDPLLLQEYGKTIDGKKLFERLFSMAGVDLRDISRSEEEAQVIEQQQLQQPELQQVPGAGNFQPEQQAELQQQPTQQQVGNLLQ